MLQQNAKQVYDIVVATFGKSQKHPHTHVQDCKQTMNDGELLHCLWSAATLDVEGSSSSDKKIGSIVMVCPWRLEYALN